MNMKKGIIVICTIIVMVLGVFFATKLIDKESKVSDNSKKQNIVLNNNQSKDKIKTNDPQNTNIDKEKENTNSEKLVEENKNNDNVTEKKLINKGKLNEEEEETNKKPNELDRDVDNERDDERDDETSSNDAIKLGKYKIEKGDTLFKIAKAYMPNSNIDKVVKTIMEENNITDVNLIKVGDEIAIPYEEPNKIVSASLGNKYTIQKGDSLFKIAKNQMSKYSEKQAVEKIKEVNKISNENDIKAGNIIYIPQ